MSAANDLNHTRPTSILDYAPGMYPDVPELIYHTKALGLCSKGALDHMMPTPAHYKAWIDGEIEDDETPALRLGKAIHAAILEPARFERTYVIAPDFGPIRKTDGCSSEQAKENKLRKQEWYAAHDGCTILTSESGKHTIGMVRKLLSVPETRAMLSGGVPELTLRWRCPSTGVECKARPDWYREDASTCIDIKSTEDASEDGFARALRRYRYGWQHAHYSNGFAALGKPLRAFLFLCIEKRPPYEFGIYQVDAEEIAKSHMAIRDLMATMSECLKTGRWSGYPRHIKTVGRQSWAA